MYVHIFRTALSRVIFSLRASTTVGEERVKKINAVVGPTGFLFLEGVVGLCYRSGSSRNPFALAASSERAKESRVRNDKINSKRKNVGKAKNKSAKEKKKEVICVPGVLGQ